MSLFVVERITKSLLVHPEISQKKRSMMYMILRRTTALLMLAAAAVLMPAAAACAEEASVESERNELRAFMVKSCSDHYPIGQGKCNMPNGDVIHGGWFHGYGYGEKYEDEDGSEYL